MAHFLVTLDKSLGGGIGRRKGFKIPWGSVPVRVRFPPQAPQSRHIRFSSLSHLKDLTALCAQESWQRYRQFSFHKPQGLLVTLILLAQDSRKGKPYWILKRPSSYCGFPWYLAINAPGADSICSNMTGSTMIPALCKALTTS